MALPAREPLQLVPPEAPVRGPEALIAVVWGAYPAIRAGLRSLLDEVGIATADDAGAAARTVVVADVGDQRVRDLLVEVRDRFGAEVPVIVIAAEPAAFERVRAGPEVPAGMLLRDATAEELGAAVQAVAAGLSVLDPSVAGAIGGRPSSQDPPLDPLEERLTERELDVLRELALGLPNKTIALRLGISEHTVKYHVGEILGKLDASSRTEAVMMAARRGLLPL